MNEAPSKAAMARWRDGGEDDEGSIEEILVILQAMCLCECLSDSCLH